MKKQIRAGTDSETNWQAINHSLFKSRVRKNFRQALWSLLPKKLRHHIIRKNVVFSQTTPEGVIFKLATTKDELEQAFKLLHDNYVSQNFMDAHPSGMRLTKYHALPSTSTLIAVKNGQVLATVSIIRSSVFGMPSEMVFNLDFLKTKKSRIAEISALAVHPSYSRQRGLLLWPLIKFMHHYSTEFFGADYIVIVVSPEWYDFYAATWFFEPLSKTKIDYKYVKNARSMGGYMKNEHRRTKAELTYKSMPLAQNYFNYIYELSFDCFQFPERNFFSISDPVMTPDILDYFFNQKSNVFAELTDLEKVRLRSLYNSVDFFRVLPPLNSSRLRELSLNQNYSDKRFEVECEAQLQISLTSKIKMHIKNVSISGIGGVLNRSLRSNEIYQLCVLVAWADPIHLKVVPVWNSNDGSCGFVITHRSAEWNNFIQLLDQDLLKNKKANT